MLPEIPPLKPIQPPRAVKPWDLLNPNKSRVEAELKAKRMAICNACPFFMSVTQQCSKCGCVMPLKTKLAEAFCPEGKWHQELPENL
jgi:hypothetical protein